MKPTKADIARALVDCFNEGMAGDFWSEENLGYKGWWIKNISPCAHTCDQDMRAFWVGDFRVVVTKPRNKEE